MHLLHIHALTPCMQAELEAKSQEVQATQHQLRKSEDELKRCEQQLRESRVRLCGLESPSLVSMQGAGG